MRPRKKVVLCSRNHEQAALFAYVATHRLPIEMLLCGCPYEALATSEKHNAHLLMFFNCDAAPSPQFDLSMSMAKVLSDTCASCPILIWDRARTEAMKPFVNYSGEWSNNAALEIVRLNLARKRGPRPTHIFRTELVTA